MAPAAVEAPGRTGVSSGAPPLAARPRLVRAATFTALAGWGAIAWGDLVSPASPDRVLGAIVLVVAWAPVFRSVARRPRRSSRWALSAAVAVAQVAGVLLLAGAPGRVLVPDGWGDLAAGLGQGLAGLPSLLVPYDGPDVWVRTVLLAGGGLLTLAAGWLAFRPRAAPQRPPVGAAVVLGGFYGIAIVQHGPGLPFLAGAIFAALLAAFLWAERVPLGHVPRAATFTAVAIAAAMLLAPSVDGARALLDYEHIADGLRPQGAAVFAWNHRYGPLNWSRDGREVLRIRARRPAYWKAASLDVFDGVRWRTPTGHEETAPETQYAAGHSDWYEIVSVVVRRLRSVEYFGAATTREILDSPRDAIRTSGGTFQTDAGDPLAPGDAYRASVYAPRPTPAQLARDTGAYPGFVATYLLMLLPPEVGGPPRAAGVGVGLESDSPTTAQIQFPAWGERQAPSTIYPGGQLPASDGEQVLRRSGYARVYALAQRLRRQSSSPYDFLRRVQRRVQAGATYSETPAVHDIALDAFLFDDRRGYCQQFSGAMALLLRMGGVPARVAAGFAPGAYEARRREYVVRDVDAHSWVEVYFPRYGWVTFDPTPAIAPPRSQSVSAGEGGLLVGDRPDRDLTGQTGPAVDGGLEPGHSIAWWPFVLLAMVIVGIALAAAELRRRGRPPGPPLAGELAELVRALHRTGRGQHGALTLVALERLLEGDAAEYVRRLRERRYAGRGAPPTAEQRRALRRALGEGLGPMGRVRAWWALPPVGGALRRSYTET